MDIMLYPYHRLAPYPSDPKPTPAAARLAALLLYYDSVTLGRPGTASELALPDKAELYDEMAGLIKVHGERAVADCVLGKDLPRQFTARDIAVLRAVRYVRDLEQFEVRYAPLLDVGVLRVTSLATVLETKEAMVGVLQGFLRAYELLHDWFEQDMFADRFTDAYLDADGVGLAGLYLQQIAQQTYPGVLTRPDLGRRGEFFIWSYLLDAYHQTLLANQTALPLLSLNELHLSLRGHYLRALRRRQQGGTAAPLADEAALRVGAETLWQIPTVVPRSPRAILRLRTELGEELAALRQGLDQVGELLLHKRHGDVHASDMQDAAQDHFVRPLQAYKQRLDTLPGSFLKEVYTSEALVEGMLTAIATARMIPSASVLVDLIVAVAAAGVAASFRTARSLRKFEDEPGLAFLLKAEEVLAGNH